MNLNFKDIFSNINNAIVIVKTTDDPPSQPPKYVRLNLTDNLLIIRKKLEKDYNCINNSLLFSKKYPEINDESYGFAEIAPEKEDDFRLDEIIDEIMDEKILYLKKCSKPDWNYFNELRKLDYGRTIAPNGIEVADKRAFKMKDCELTEIGAEGCRKGDVEFKSNEERIIKENLFFSTNVNVQNLSDLGISAERLKNKSFNFETNSSYNFTEYGKVSLKFSEDLEPTQEFIERVNIAINFKNLEEFKRITAEFGQFIPTEVILGGRAHFDNFGISTGRSAENSEEITASMNTLVLGVGGANTSSHSEGKSNQYRYNCIKLIGGEQPNSLENFDEETWVKSLKDYEKLDCIEYQNPISIFQLLPEDLRKQIIISIGKRIHYTAIKNLIIV